MNYKPSNFKNNQLCRQLLLLGCFFTASVVAETPDKTQPVKAETEKALPGNTSLVSSADALQALSGFEKGHYNYSVKDYFQRPKQSAFRFSPDGKFISYREKDANSKRHIFVKNTETNEVKRVIVEGDDLVSGYGWANNSRLIYVKDKGGDENYSLFAVDLDGNNQKHLTPFDGVQVSIVDDLKDQKDHMIISMNKDNPQVFEPFKININSGELDKLFENKDISNPISGYSFDKNGHLKAYTQQQNGIEYVLKYRLSDKAPFETVVETSWQDTFYIIDFNYETPNPHDAYVMSNLENDTNEIVLYDFAEKKTIRKIYANDEFDLQGMSTSRKRGYEVDYIYYNGTKSQIIPVSKTYKKRHKKFTKEFKNQDYSVISTTDEEDKYLLYVSSDKLYGIYYLYNVKDASFKKVFDLMPQLKPADMAEMRPIKFKSRDGLTIHGYLTIPKGAEKNNQARVIVNPHGGPYGPRDSWGFNPESQLFASRGYATLQINYRGSGGYGKAFFLAGSKQIGRKMLNDLEDGLAYVKTMNFIDGSKTAIYGGSYGGLATLGSLVKTPDLYACGVDYVGVSNLFTFYDSFPDYWKPYLRQVYAQWYDETNAEEKVIMKAVSPALNVEKITKPLFIIQGANDPRVNINESDQMVQNLRSRGFDVPYMVKYNEGHGFANEDNRIELYQAMMGFYAKCLK